MPIPEEEFLLISDSMAKFVKNYTLRVGNDILTEGYNQGEHSASQEIGANGAQYSAYLEGNPCDFCRALDGMTVDFRQSDGYELFDKYSPAQHPNCQCIWIYILEDDFKAQNKGFEEKWQETFRKQNPELDLSKPEIIETYAGSNLFTRAQYWVKEPGFNIVSQEIMDRKLARVDVKMVGDTAKLLGLTSKQVSALEF